MKMIDTIIGIVLIILGILWLRHQIKKTLKPTNIIEEPMNWTANFKGYAGSVLTIFLGILFLLHEASYTMLF